MGKTVLVLIGFFILLNAIGATPLVVWTIAFLARDDGSA